MDFQTMLQGLIDQNKFNPYVYNGMTMIAMFPANILDKIKDTAFHDDDVVVATYPKCGKLYI